MFVIGCMWLFFFFKQKTAYEMRISDWSSDVCSSDLQAKDEGPLRPIPLWHIRTRTVNPRERACTGARRVRRAGTMFDRLSSLVIALKIGRASCRERVC